MSLEIEHKFLIKNNNWKQLVKHSKDYRQGYLISDDKRSVRIRTSNDKAWLNIKSATLGTQRDEFEYQIPLNEATEMIDSLCEKPLIEKTRHFVPFEQHTWEIDIFYGENEGLIVAEIELSTLNERFKLPEWIGKEVTNDRRYYNNNLCKHPYCNW